MWTEIKRNQTITKIAACIGCGEMTADRHFTRHEIERNPGETSIKDPRVADESWLSTEYVEKRASAESIADEIGYSAKHIRKWLKRHGIEGRTGSETVWYPELADSSYLQERYVDDELFLHELAEEIGCSVKGVHRALIRNGIIEPDGVEQNRPHAAAPYHTNTQGYEVWSVPAAASTKAIFVHRLVAVADGADPYFVYDGAHSHHENQLSWDNRPSTTEVLPHLEHTRRHNNERWSQ